MNNINSVKRGKRRVRKPFIILVLLVAVTLSFLTVKTIVKTLFNNEVLTFKTAEVFNIEEYENINFNVVFTNDKKVNAIINDEILRVVEDNKDIFTTKANLDINVLGNIDEERSFLNLKFTNASENIKDIYGVSNIDLKNNKVVDLSTIAHEDLKGLSMLLREDLAKDESLKYNKNMYLNTSFDKDLFKYALFTVDGIEFNFSAEDFAIDNFSSVTLAYDKALAYVNDDIISRIDKDYSRPDLSNIRYIDPNKAMVALTYDDGPHRPTSLPIAEYFNANKSALTFFWLGDRIELNKDLVKEISQLGHEIANHSYDHPNFNTISDDALKYQTDTMNEQIKEITKQENVLIRAPYGASNETVRSKINSPLIMWSIDTEDWRTRDEASNIKNVQDTIFDGSIILMHDLYEPSVNAGMKLLDQYKDEYQFVSVSELYQYKGVKLENGQMYNGVAGR